MAVVVEFGRRPVDGRVAAGAFRRAIAGPELSAVDILMAAGAKPLCSGEGNRAAFSESRRLVALQTIRSTVFSHQSEFGGSVVKRAVFLPIASCMAGFAAGGHGHGSMGVTVAVLAIALRHVVLGLRAGRLVAVGASDGGVRAV